uniref:SCAPER_N domain-containing protein n=1 Tax=Mesocestoides corti TaxID=53468 RepID=A0A5K3FDX0_MESCO
MAVDEYIDPVLEDLRDSTADWIRLKVEREGTQARNIIKYNLPVYESRQRTVHVSPSKGIFRDYRPQSRESSDCNSVCAKSLATIASDHSSLSSGDTIQRRRTRRREDYRSLYWGQMLDTLKRTIDEIYAACELDECEIRCKEVIMILNHSEQDFKSLIEKTSLLQRFADANVGNRPACLAWDERKISPGRPIMRRVLADLDVMDVSPPTPTSVEWRRPTDCSGYRPTSALAWGSDEEDLLHEEEEEDVEGTHFDEAIKSVACTERLLRSELGRAQSEEATLRHLEGRDEEEVFENESDIEEDEEEHVEVSVPDRKASCRVCYACSACAAGDSKERARPASGYSRREISRKPSSKMMKSVAVETEPQSCEFDYYPIGSATTTPTKPRTPGRSVQMHEKLSSQRKAKCESSIQEIEAKQARARTLRQRHLLERSNRVRELSKKVEEVRKQKLRLIQQRRNFLEQRLLVAEANRRAELERRILKAHDEEIKGREIAFIQTLEAEQKQHTIFAKHAISCARLKERAELRRRRLEEKAEREEAAKLRRIELEAIRLARLDELQARWISRAHEIEMRGEQTKLVRREAARAKEHNRELKLANLEHQQRSHIEELRSNILRKQRECERRHQETLSGIRRKALEMSAPCHDGDAFSTSNADVDASSSTPHQRWCRLCRVLVSGDLHAVDNHFATRGHRRALLNSIPASQRLHLNVSDLNNACLVDLPSSSAAPNSSSSSSLTTSALILTNNQRRSIEVERQRLLGRRLNVIRQRISSRAHVYRKAPLLSATLTPDCPQKSQLQKLIKEARRYYNLPESGPWVASRVGAIEKALHAIHRLISPSSTNDKTALLCCLHLDLLPVAVGLVDLTRSQRYFDFPVIPARTVSLACGLLTVLCENAVETSWHLLFNGDLALLVDCLAVKLARLEALELGDSAKHKNNKQEEKAGEGVVEEMASIRDLFRCLLVASRGLESSPPSSGASDEVSTKASRKSKTTLVSASITDYVAYMVNSGLPEILTSRLSSPTLSAELAALSDSSGCDSQQFLPNLALLSINFLTALVKLIPATTTTAPTKPSAFSQQQKKKRGKATASRSAPSSAQTDDPQTALRRVAATTPADDQLEACPADPTFFFDSVASTEVFGIIALLYGMLQIAVNSVGHRAGSSFSGDLHDSGSISLQRLFVSSSLVSDIILSSLRLVNYCAVVNQPKIQEIVSSNATSVQLRHILGSILTACTPSEDEAEKPLMKTSSSAFSIASSIKTSSSSSTTGGCLAGKRKRNTSSLVPTGAKEVGVVRSTHASPVASQEESAKLLCSNRRSSQDDTTLVANNATRQLLHEAIICLGFLTSLHERNQANLCRCVPGSPNSGTGCLLLLKLCRLPVAYFSQPALANILFPTLISCCFLNSDNTSILLSELNPSLVANYIEASILENTLVKPDDRKLSSIGPGSNPSSSNHDFYHRFENRFPFARWHEAKAFFADAASKYSLE